MAVNKPVTQPGPMARGGKVTPLDQGFLKRVANGLSSLFRAPAVDQNGVPTPQEPADNSNVWSGPGQPIRPVVMNRADVAGREDNYPVGYNINTQPRRNEGPSFEQLESLAENLDILALAIATREDQMCNLTGSVLPRKQAGQELRAQGDARCANLDNFFRQPDGRQSFRGWVRQLTHEQLVYDAPAIYVRRTLGGEVYRLEVVKGSTLSVQIDKTGRMPDPPTAAYQQILQGVPAIDYTADELIYWPRNRRPGKRYGYSPVQQVLMTVNIAIRREVTKLSYFTEGNIPEALVSVPSTWTADVIERFQAIWDAAQADLRNRSKLRFVPGDMRVQQTRSDNMLMAPVDEWLARVICYAFSLSPAAFVAMMNRATAESSYEEALAEGLQPMMLWFKDLMDHIIQMAFGYDDLEWVWDEEAGTDPGAQEERDITLVQRGMKSIDEYLVSRGREPIGMGPAIFGIGPLGIMFIDDLLKAKAMGLTMPQAPPPPDAMGGMGGGIGGGMPGGPPGMPPGMPGMPPGMPMPGQQPGGVSIQPGAPMRPAAQAAIQTISPDLLNAVGLGARGARRVDVTQADARQSDPLSNVVVHPKVLDTLREVERKQGRAKTR